MSFGDAHKAVGIRVETRTDPRVAEWERHGGIARKQHRLNIGDVVASRTPAVLHTVLGSCVSICLWDPVELVGGMNHILLPKGANEGHATRFGLNAMELLINKIMAMGGSRSRLVAKAFGGANVIASLQSPTVGERNAEFVKGFLAAERIALVAQRLGGNQAVEVRFSTDTAKAMVGTVDGTRLRKRVAEEESYGSYVAGKKSSAGETTLF